MTHLLNTPIILWLSGLPGKISPRARHLIKDSRSDLRYLRFSPASIREVSIKALKGRPGFRAEPSEIAAGLVPHGIIELPVESVHAAHVRLIPSLRKNTLDRLLLAQAVIENFTVSTTDGLLLRYPSNVMDAR